MQAIRFFDDLDNLPIFEWNFGMRGVSLIGILNFQLIQKYCLKNQWPLLLLHNDVKFFLVCTRFHNEKSLPVRQITWIMLTKTEIMRTISHFFGQNYFHNHDQNFKLCTHYENNLTKIFFAFSKLLIEPNFGTNFRFRLIWDSVRLSLFGRPRFGLIGNSVQLSPLVFLDCCNVAFFIMEASTDQKNFHDIMRIMAVNIGPNSHSLRSNPHYENNFDRYSRHFSP